MLRMTDRLERGKRRSCTPDGSPRAFLRRLPVLLAMFLCSGCGDSDPDNGNGQAVGPPGSRTAQENPVAQEAPVDPEISAGNDPSSAQQETLNGVEVSVADLQRRRSEFSEGTSLKVTGAISRIAFGEPTKKGPHYAIWLHKQVFGDGFYDIECLFDGSDGIDGLAEDQTVTVQGTREKSYLGVKLVDCRIVDRGETPLHTAQEFDDPIFQSSLEFPEAPEGLTLKAYLPYELEIEEEAILEDGSLPADYMSALGKSPVVRNVEVSSGISNKGLKQIAALKGMKMLRISPGLGSDAIDISQLDFGLLANHPRLRTLTLSTVEGVSDDTLIQIGQFQCLAKLAFNSARGSITDAGLAGLASLKSLRTFTVPQFRGEVKITDDGIAAFAGMPYLQALQISSKPMTGSGLSALRDCPNFEILRLPRSSVTAEGLVSLTELSQLRFLELRDTEVDDEIAPVIAKMSKLEHLSLAETKITDAFFEKWGPPPQLVDLDLSKTKLTDRGVELLSSNPPGHLRFLGLRNYGDEITGASLEFVNRIKTLEKLIAPSTFDDAAKKSLRDRGLDVR